VRLTGKFLLPKELGGIFAGYTGASAGIKVKNRRQT
jgi:hypothetical protein